MPLLLCSILLLLTAATSGELLVTGTLVSILMCVMVYGMSTGAQLSIEAVLPVVEQGGNLFPVTTLGCIITGAQSTPIVRWRHENETSTELNTGKYVVTINPLQAGNIIVLTINNLVYTDSGVYICEVMDNSSSWVSATAELRLLSECTTHNIQCTHVLLVCSLLLHSSFKCQ